jgi:hypothetical protein
MLEKFQGGEVVSIEQEIDQFCKENNKNNKAGQKI